MIDIIITVPYYPTLSKNASHHGNHRRKRETIVAQNDIAYSLMQKVKKHEWTKGRLIEVWIHVYYKKEGTDVHNFQAAILDALEAGSGVNDSWMKPIHIDGWKAAKGDEGIEIRMEQK